MNIINSFLFGKCKNCYICVFSKNCKILEKKEYNSYCCFDFQYLFM